MKKAGAIIQTFLISCALFVLLLSIACNRSFFIAFLFLQVLLGFWQLFSSLILLINYRNQTFPAQKTLLIYWKTIHVYAIILTTLIILKLELPAIICFFSGWLIMIYYYVFTISAALGKMPARRTFMDVMS